MLSRELERLTDGSHGAHVICDPGDVPGLTVQVGTHRALMPGGLVEILHHLFGNVRAETVARSPEPPMAGSGDLSLPGTIGELQPILPPEQLRQQVDVVAPDESIGIEMMRNPMNTGNE
jgi:hypothetical protein